MAVTIENVGDANLTLVSCTITGTHFAQFNLVDCVTGAITPAGMRDVEVTCNPSTTGLKTASLDLVTNDADEGNVSYDLNCTGISPPKEDLIHADSFEGG